MSFTTELELRVLPDKEEDDKELNQLKSQIKIDVVRLAACYKQISFYEKKNEELFKLEEKAMRIKREIKDHVKAAKSKEMRDNLVDYYTKTLQEQCSSFGIEINRDWRPGTLKILAGILLIGSAPESSAVVIAGIVVFGFGLYDLSKERYSVSPSKSPTQEVPEIKTEAHK